MQNQERGDLKGSCPVEGAPRAYLLKGGVLSHCLKDLKRYRASEAGCRFWRGGCPSCSCSDQKLELGSEFWGKIQGWSKQEVLSGWAP